MAHDCSHSVMRHYKKGKVLLQGFPSQLFVLVGSSSLLAVTLTPERGFPGRLG